MNEQAVERDRLLRQLQRTASAQRERGASTEPADRSKDLPLSFAQQRLWFIDQIDGVSAAYHLGGAVRLHGVLDRPALRKSLDTIVERHEALRTTFAQVNGEVRPEVREIAAFELREVDRGGHEAEEREAQIARHAAQDSGDPFDLSAGPLIRGRLLRLSDEEHVLILTMHHIVADGWSVGILLEEVRTLYAAYREGRANPLAPLPI